MADFASSGLTGSRAKLSRAKVHFDTLEASISAFIEANPYSISVEREEGGLEHVYRVTVHREAPVVEWALLVGDCVHNMRSVLDHLTWALSESHSGIDPNDRTTQFPIFDSESRFKKHGLRQISRVSPAARARIEALQPYHAEDPRLTPLYALNVLDNSDKHRLLWVTALAHRESTFQFRPTSGLLPRPTFDVSEQPLEHNAVIARVRFDSPTPNMEVNIQFTYTVVFRERLVPHGYSSVVDSLGNIHQAVTGVVNNFVDLFGDSRS